MHFRFGADAEHGMERTSSAFMAVLQFGAQGAEAVAHRPR